MEDKIKILESYDHKRALMNIRVVYALDFRTIIKSNELATSSMDEAQRFDNPTRTEKPRFFFRQGDKG